MTAMPIYSKNPLKILFSGTKGPMTLGFGMQHQGLGPNKVYSNDDLGLTMAYSMARSNFFLMLFILENIHFFMVAQSEVCLLGMQATLSSIPTSDTFFRGDLVMNSRRAVVSYWRKNVH